MKLSTLNSKLHLGAVGTNAKTKKGDTDQSLTLIMYLMPGDLSGHEVCPNRSPSCTENCLFTSGRGAMTTVQKARERKTKLYFEDNPRFMSLLKEDITLFQTYCKDNNIPQMYVRLNGTSDLDFTSIMPSFPDIQFYDYTKVPSRIKIAKELDNYHLTFSRDENTTNKALLTALTNKINVAMVFDHVPDSYTVDGQCFQVVDGDLSDLRPLDGDGTNGVIVGLKPKGKLRKALKENTDNGFVVRV